MKNVISTLVVVMMLALGAVDMRAQEKIIHVAADGTETVYLPATKPATQPSTKPVEPNESVITILPEGTYPDWVFPIESGRRGNPNIYDGQGKVVIDFGQPKITSEADGKTKIDYTGTDGFWTIDADHVIIRNVTIRGGGTGLQGEKAATRVTDGRTGIFFEKCTFEQSIGCGVSINDSIDSGIIECIIQDNGQIGYAFARTTNALIKGNIIRRNNPGFDFDPKFVVNGNVQTIQVGKKWHIKTGFESGGAKGARTKGAIIDNNEAYENYGPGIVWFDIENTDAIIRNNHAHHNKKISGNGGQGIFVELNSVGKFRIENNRVHDNEGAGIAIAETRDVVLRNNRFENDELNLRNLPARADSSLKDIRIVGNTFVNSSIETRQGDWDAKTASRNKIELRDNQFQGEFRLKWGDRTYDDLSKAKAAIGQPIGQILP